MEAKLESRTAELPPLAVGALAVLAGAKLLLHLFTNGNYGYFIDELYYIACSEHLDFGYVDHPPLSVVVLWLSRAVLGDSLPALRFLPALAGAATVFLAGMIARSFGGRRFAQVVAGIAVIISPLFLYMNTIVSMNVYDVLIWALAAWLVALIINREEGVSVPKLWLLLGLVLGVGLQNKISVLFFGFALVVGLLLTSQRRHLITAWPWAAGAISFGIFLPHIIWQMANDWPTLEFIHNASVLKNRPMSVFEFLGAQMLELHPLNQILLFLGLWFFLISRTGKPYRLFGWMYLALFAVLVTRNAKPYYAGPIYPLMLAGGGVAVELLIARTRKGWPQFVVVVLLVVSGATLAPMALPVLPVETFIRYQHRLLGGTIPSSEQKEVGPLPQHYADMFGNEEMVALVAEVFHELTPEERARCTIWGMAYPQAGAVDFFGPRYGLPKAISSHNNYWLWGPGKGTGEILISAGLNEEILGELYEEVSVARTFHHPYAMPWRNNHPIFLCRRPRVSLKEAWPEFKHFE